MINAFYCGFVGSVVTISINYLLYVKLPTIDLLFKIPNSLAFFRMLLNGIPMLFNVAIMGYLRRYFMQLPGMEHLSLNYNIYFGMMTISFVGSLFWFAILPIARYPR